MPILTKGITVVGGDANIGLIPHRTLWIPTRGLETVSIPNDNIGGEITLLQTTVTPAKDGNWIELLYEVFGECDGTFNVGFKVYKNTGSGDVILPNSSNVTNDRTHVIRTFSNDDDNFGSTPGAETFSITDDNASAVATTYKLFVVMTTSQSSKDFDLNSSSDGVSELGYSSLKINEYIQ